MFLVDAAQSAGVVPIDLKTTPIDMLAFPGHKALYGPTGTGALYVGPPRQSAGLARRRDRGRFVERDTNPSNYRIFWKAALQTSWESPDCSPGSSGSPAEGSKSAGNTRSTCFRRSLTGPKPPKDGDSLADGKPETHVGALSLIVPEGISPQELGGILDGSFDIAVRPGLHCSPYIHKAIGTFPDGTLRLSPGPFTTEVEIDAFLTALAEITAGVL